MSSKKIFLALAVFLFAIIFSGCGKSKDSAGTLEKKPATEASSASLPAATGNPDDVGSALLDEIESEKEDALLEEQEALNSIDDGVEADNFKNSYDENEL